MRWANFKLPDTKFPQSAVCQKWWKYVDIWRLYCKNKKGDSFFGPQCTYTIQYFHHFCGSKFPECTTSLYQHLLIAAHPLHCRIDQTAKQETPLLLGWSTHGAKSILLKINVTKLNYVFDGKHVSISHRWDSTCNFHFHDLKIRSFKVKYVCRF